MHTIRELKSYLVNKITVLEVLMTKINSQVHFFINEAVEVKRHNAMAFFRAETG